MSCSWTIFIQKNNSKLLNTVNSNGGLFSHWKHLIVQVACLGSVFFHCLKLGHDGLQKLVPTFSSTYNAELLGKENLLFRFYEHKANICILLFDIGTKPSVIGITGPSFRLIWFISSVPLLWSREASNQFVKYLRQFDDDHWFCIMLFKSC